MRIAFEAGLIAGLWAVAAAAQSPPVDSEAVPIHRANRITLHSARLDEERAILVATPRSYQAAPDARWPVIFVLDAEVNFELTVSVVDYLATLDLMPPAIVVGLSGAARERDYTPGARNGWSPPVPAETGGAEAFLDHVQDEVLPLIDRRYRTVGWRVVIGHSLGGLLATHALAERPGLFQAALLLDPALWWNERAHVETLIGSMKGRDRPARIVSAEALGGLVDDWARLVSAAGPAFSGAQLKIPGETHPSLPLRGIPEGLRALFADWPLEFADPAVRPIDALRYHYDQLSSSLGWTVAPPIAALVAAATRSVDGGDDAGALEVARMGLEAWGTVPALERIAARASASIQGGGRDVTPLVIPSARPSPDDLSDWLGFWTGVIDRLRGVDADFDLEIAAAGDTVVARTTFTYPDGVPRSGTWQVIRMTADGALELGEALRGLPGMLVWTMRREGRSATGTASLRGVRPPPGVTIDGDTIRLERGGVDARPPDGRPPSASVSSSAASPAGPPDRPGAPAASSQPAKPEAAR